MTAPNIAVRQAAPEDAATVATLVFELLLELAPSHAGIPTADELMPVAAGLLGDDDVWAYLAETRDGRAIGARLTGAKTSQTSGPAACGRLRSATVTVQPFRAASISARDSPSRSLNRSKASPGWRRTTRVT